MLSVAGADHIITMDLHASQIQVSKQKWKTRDILIRIICIIFVIVAAVAHMNLSML